VAPLRKTTSSPSVIAGLDVTQEPMEPPSFPSFLEGDNRFDHYGSSQGAVGNHISTLALLGTINGDGGLAIGGTATLSAEFSWTI